MRTDKDYTKTKPKISGYLRGITAETTSNRINLSDSDFVYNTLTIRQSTSEAGEFTVGAAIISSCNFSLWNNTGKFDSWDWTNSAAEIYLEFDTDKVYLGSYVIISHTTGGNTIKVEALDWLKVFDSHNIGECDITFPADAVSVINTIVTTGVQNMLVSGLDSVSSVMLADPADTEMSNRDALAYIAQCLGRFITSRSDDATKKTTLRFAWYNTDEAYSAGTTFSHQLRTDNINITGVEVTTSDGETTESRGDSTGYVVKIMDNPFISSDNVSAVADNIAASCVGLGFRPGDFAILSNVRIEAGDTITIDTPKEKGVLTLASDVTYKPAQVKESVIAHAEEAEGDLQITKAAYVKNIIRNELNNPNSDLGSAVSGGGVEMISGKFSRVAANISGATKTVTVTGNYTIIRKRDESQTYYPTILHGVIQVKPRCMSLAAGDYVTVSIPDLVANGKGNIAPSQYYNNGLMASDEGNMGATIWTRLTESSIFFSNNQVRVVFPDATIKSGMDKDPTIYIPVTIYA